MNPTINLLAKAQEPKKHRGILFRRLPNAVSLSVIGLVFSLGLVTCLAVANPPPLPVSPPASVAVRPSLTAAKNNESGPQPQVLSAQVTLPNTAIDPSALTQKVESILYSYLTRGKFKGEKGDKGEPGTSAVTSSGDATTVSVGGYPIISYYQSQPPTGFTGGSMAGITFLSSNSFVAEQAAVNSQLTVAGPATFASSVALATTTASSLTVSGLATFSGSTTIAGLTVTGLNPGLTVGSVAFQGASGLAQDNSNLFWDDTNNQLQTSQLLVSATSSLATTTLSQLTTTGNVGVGTTDATSKLTVSNLSTSQASLLLNQQSNTFVKTIGGTGYELNTSSQQTSDGGYVMGGFTFSFGAGSNDAYIMKFDSSGNLSWAKTIGTTGDEYGGFVRQTSDGGYILATQTTGLGAGGTDALVVKLDSTGNITWAKTYGGSGYDDTDGIQQTSDGGYIVAGNTNTDGSYVYDIRVLKLDSSGNLSWSKTIGGASYDGVYGINSVQQTSDGGYVVTGYTDNYGAGGYDILIIKLDSLGTLSWAKTIGGASTDYPGGTQQTSDGGYLVSGYTKSYGAGNKDILVTKLDSSGNFSWAKTIGGGADDISRFAKQTSDGGYVILGDTKSYGAGGSDILIAKLDSSGNLSWAKTIGGTGTETAGGSIQQTSDEGYVVSAYTDSYGAGYMDALLIKLDSTGSCSGCSLVADATPTVSSQTPTVSNVVPTVTTPSPTVSAQSLTAVSFSPTVSTLCSGTTTFSPLTVDSSGRIGIGTTSPMAQLDVAGVIKATGLCFGTSCYSSMPESPWTRLGSNILYNTGNVGIGTSTVSSNLTIQGSALSPTTSLFTLASSSGSTLFTVTSAGLVGINSSTPIATLTVQGIAGSTNPFVVASSTGTQLLTVLANGNVGIGTTSPAYLLHVGSASVASGTVARFQNVNGTCDINATTNTLSCSSDERLKTNIRDIQNALDAVSTLRGVWFNWKTETASSTPHLGFLAQEVEKIMPELVSTDPSSGLKSIGYSNFVPLIVEALKAQQEEIHALQGAPTASSTLSSDTLTVTQPVVYEGTLTVKGHVAFSGDTVGEAEMLPGATSVRVTFSEPYELQPIVTFSALERTVGAHITAKDTTGFTIEIDAPLAESVTFDWHAFGGQAARLFVSDGTVRDLTLVPLSGLASPGAADPASNASPTGTDPSLTTEAGTASSSPASAESAANAAVPDEPGSELGALSSQRAMVQPATEGSPSETQDSGATPPPETAAPVANDGPSGAENAPPAP